MENHFNTILTWLLSYVLLELYALVHLTDVTAITTVFFQLVVTALTVYKLVLEIREKRKPPPAGGRENGRPEP